MWERMEMTVIEISSVQETTVVLEKIVLCGKEETGTALKENRNRYLKKSYTYLCMRKKSVFENDEYECEDIVFEKVRKWLH